MFYAGNNDSPLQGGGQGNSVAPPMWIALTVVLIKMMNDLPPGFKLLAPGSSISHHGDVCG